MMDGGHWSKNNEQMVIEMRDQIIMRALARGYNVIVDDTNLHDKHVTHIQEMVQVIKDVEIEVKNFTDVSVDECIKRDLKRQRSVGEKVIRDIHKQFLYKPNLIEQDPSLPEAIIVDVDGTLAEMNGRSPYDWSKVGEDKPNLTVSEIVGLLRDDGEKNVIICTGRDGSCKEATMYWLSRWGIQWDDFYIRPEGNIEKDSVIKRRFLEDIVKKYYVTAVFDDRDQVVEMWRDAGLQCFQVAEGDF